MHPPASNTSSAAAWPHHGFVGTVPWLVRSQGRVCPLPYSTAETALNKGKQCACTGKQPAEGVRALCSTQLRILHVTRTSSVRASLSNLLRLLISCRCSLGG
eukprot:scaffold144910_cov21-Tisochrysis_lutea.AAC.1